MTNERKAWKLYSRKGDTVVETEIEFQQPIPNISDIDAAFREVFSAEKLVDVEFISEKERTVLTVHSILTGGDRKIRTYAHYPNQTYKELFEKTPHLEQN